MTDIEDRLSRLETMARLRNMYDAKCRELAEADRRIATMDEHSKARDATYDVLTQALDGYKADYARLEEKHEAFVKRVHDEGLSKHAMNRAEKIARDYGGYAGYKHVADVIADAIGKAEAE